MSPPRPSPTDGWAPPRIELANDLDDELRRLDSQIKESTRRLPKVVNASRTTTTKIFGVVQ
jgi:hypothetical protein